MGLEVEMHFNGGKEGFWEEKRTKGGILDVKWIPSGWWEERGQSSFFQKMPPVLNPLSFSFNDKNLFPFSFVSLPLPLSKFHTFWQTKSWNFYFSLLSCLVAGSPYFSMKSKQILYMRKAPPFFWNFKITLSIFLHQGASNQWVGYHWGRYA